MINYFKPVNIQVLLFYATLFNMSFLVAQKKVVPASLSNISYDKSGELYYEEDGKRYYADTTKSKLTIKKLLGNPSGTDDGIQLDFGDMNGSITYGLIPYGKAPHPLPVYRFTKKLENGKVDINIVKDFRYPYDFVDWKENKYLTIGYRFASDKGEVLFDGEVSVTGDGPFKITPSIYEGPFVNNVTENSVDIWFKTSVETQGSVSINGKTYKDTTKAIHHEWTISNLEPNTKYDYKVKYGGLSQEYFVETAPMKGSSEPFVFAYASDSRHAKGSGERRIYGANAYIMKKIGALAYSKEAAFMQFSGDMINGYLSDYDEIQLQYTNWKKAVEPFWHYMPYNIGMGNHEALGHIFKDGKSKRGVFVDGFPYETESGEAAFAEAFVNPTNGPDSEDGSKFDPSKKTIDFPSYRENVFYYTYGNTAMIVLNSNYWFSPSLKKETSSSGGLHAYIMDNQLKWLEETVLKLEADQDIKHVFVTQHTPVFPNGGHAKDDMWYLGNNDKRPYVSGKPVDYGILERRDQYLDILCNKSTKVVAVLTGDEHNYNWLKVEDKLPRYPEGYDHKKLKISRPIYQVNNGAAGAPYYGQEKLPWSDFTQSFSVENALCLFYVDGDRIKMVVLNPDTLNKIDEVQLK